jgi:hypothetical protein
MTPHLDRAGVEITGGYRLYSGTTMTQQDADQYNRMTDEIDWKEKAGRECEYLRDCRHRFFQVCAGFY